jgi:serine/threonine protein kinase
VGPEVLKGRPYSYKADIFGAGSVFFNLLSRRYLFSGTSADEVLKRNAQCRIDHILKYLETTSRPCVDLLFKMLQPDPALRPTAAEALQHEWFKIDRDVILDLLDMNKLMCSQLPPDIPNIENEESIHDSCV